MAKAHEVEALRAFYKGKRVYVTGIQGFKGVWMAVLLRELGAEVHGCGLQDPYGHLFDLVSFERLGMEARTIDVRDGEALKVDLQRVDPEVIFHLAAQPIVSKGYSEPVETFESNVMGTVHIMEAVRSLKKPVSFVSITSDKCYRNVEKNEPYLEDDTLMGEDPYSASKSAAEIVAFSYRKSFFEREGHGVVMSTCRAGNVIGGGDFALNRIVPDMARAWKAGVPVSIRNFQSTRPYEHVLDAVYAYVLLAMRQAAEPELAGAYNIGPNDESLMKTHELLDYFQAHSDLQVHDASGGEVFHESTLLALDSGKLRRTLGWAPTWASKEQIVGKTFAWYEQWLDNDLDMTNETTAQVKEFLND